MPLYEFRCRSCDERFEAWLGSGEAQTGVACPDGHTETVRIFSAVGMTGKAGAPASAAARPSAPCGSACGCYHG